MEKAKQWENYTHEEKASLLRHWFHYYGGTVITFKELDDFSTLAETHQEELFDLIMTSLIAQNTIQSNILIFSMRQNKVEELFQHIIRYNSLPEAEKEKFNSVRQLITDEIVGSFLQPEPPVPMDVIIQVEPNTKK